MRARWLPALLLSFGLGAAPAMAQTCKPAIADSDLVAPGKLQMSINPTLPPQQFVDEKGELQGLNVELMREIAKKLCIPLELIRMDFPPANHPRALVNRSSTPFGAHVESRDFTPVPFDEIERRAVAQIVIPDPKRLVELFVLHQRLEERDGIVPGQLIARESGVAGATQLIPQRFQGDLLARFAPVQRRQRR